MKKRDSFIKIPTMLGKENDVSKSKKTNFLKKIKLPKLSIKIPKITKKKSNTQKDKKQNNNKKRKLNPFRVFTGLRGRIILLVIIMTLLPLLVQTYVNLNTQTSSISTHLESLSQAVNQSLVERIEGSLTESMTTLELLPKSIDLLAYDDFERGRIILKMAKDNFKDVMLVNQNGTIISHTNSQEKGKNVSTEEWFKTAFNTEKYISDAVIESAYKVPVVTIAIPILDASFKPQAVMAAKLGLDKIQTLCKEAEIEGGIAYVVDKQGTTIAHPDYTEKVMNTYNAVENNIIGAIEVVKGNEGTKSYVNDEGLKVLGAYSIIPSTGWGLITEIDEHQAMSPVEMVKKSALIFVGFAFAIAIFGSLLLAWLITKPVVRMARIVSEIKDGNLDKKLQVTSNDEIGELQNGFNLMTESLRQVLSEVDMAVGEITATSKKLSDGASITSSATEEITSIVEDVAEGAQAQIKTINSTLSVAKEISLSVVETADSAQSVAASAKQAAQIATDGSKNINVISEKIGIIKHSVVNSADLVDKLGKKSEEVTGIVKIIRDIAGKTNMLALNASIEAARAGEAGRGFAVVANEIRNLADQTKDASKNIEELLLEIQKETEDTVVAMNEGLIEVEEGTQAISSTYGTFDKIIKEIHLVASDINLVAESVFELKGESERISKAVEDISEVAESTSMGTQSVLASTEEQSSAMQEINDSASMLSNMAGALQEIIKKFNI